MTRPSKHRLRAEHRAALAKGILRSWEPGDNVASAAARLNIPERRVKEALTSAFAAVRMRKGKGVTADVIAGETGLPREFVGHAMRANFGMRDAKRHREGDSIAVANATVAKAAERYRSLGLSRSEALREARAAYGSKPEGHV